MRRSSSQCAQVQRSRPESLDDVARREDLSSTASRSMSKVPPSTCSIGVRGRAFKDTLVLEVEAELQPAVHGRGALPRGRLAPARTRLGAPGATPDELAPRRSPRAFGKRSRRTDRLGGCALFERRADWPRVAPCPRAEAVGDPLGYLQSDAVLARLRTARRIADELSTAEIDELRRLLAPRTSALSRLARTAIRRAGSAERRALADRLQPGDATAWEDPYFF